MTAPMGDVVTTFALVALLAVFPGFRKIRPFTPEIFPPLYSVRVWAESRISGTSTNPARGLGPGDHIRATGRLLDLLDRAAGWRIVARRGL